jgi:hypothetical protein
MIYIINIKTTSTCVLYLGIKLQRIAMGNSKLLVKKISTTSSVNGADGRAGDRSRRRSR